MKHVVGPADHSDSPFDHVGREDVGRMQMVRRSHRDEKWIPAWALDDKKMRLVIFNYAHNYARTCGVKNEVGTSLREVERAALAARTQIDTPEWREHLRTSPNGFIGRATAILYKAYRQRLKATDIAEQLEMSHRAVRGVLYRLNRIAKTLFPENQQLPEQHWNLWRGQLRNTKRPSVSIWAARKRTIRPSADVSALVERFNAGATLRELASERKVSQPTIANILRKSGMALRPRKYDATNVGHFKNKFPELSKDQLEAIIRRWKAGECLADLATEVGVPRFALRARIYRRGIRCRKQLP
jgi:hypothetical protein